MPDPTYHHRRHRPGFLHRAPAFFICPSSSTSVPLSQAAPNLITTGQTYKQWLSVLTLFRVALGGWGLYIMFKRGEGRTNA